MHSDRKSIFADPRVEFVLDGDQGLPRVGVAQLLGALENKDAAADLPGDLAGSTPNEVKAIVDDLNARLPGPIIEWDQLGIPFNSGMRGFGVDTELFNFSFESQLNNHIAVKLVYMDNPWTLVAPEQNSHILGTIENPEVNIGPGFFKQNQDNKGVRLSSVIEFDIGDRLVSNDLVITGEWRDFRDKWDRWGFFEVDANDEFIINPVAPSTDRNAGKMPLEEMFPLADVLEGTGFRPEPFFNPWEMWSQRDSLVLELPSGRRGKFARESVQGDVPRTPNNSFGFTQPNRQARVRTTTQGGSAVLVSEWLNNRFNTMIGYRVDNVDQDLKNIGQNNIKSRGDTVQLGSVYHLTDRFSLYANYGETFSAPRSNLTINNEPLPALSGEAQEYGIKFNVIEGALSGSLAYFDVENQNDSERMDGQVRNNIDPPGINGQPSPSVTFFTFDRESNGVELVMTAKVGDNYRMMLTAGVVDGEEGSDVILEKRFNDEVNFNSNGEVINNLSGEPLMVPIDPFLAPEGFVSTDPSTWGDTPVQALTQSMLKNGDSNGNYLALRDVENDNLEWHAIRRQQTNDQGDIFFTEFSDLSQGLFLAPEGQSVSETNIGAIIGTGRTSLTPEEAEQNLGFTPNEKLQLVRQGGDKTTQYAEHYVNFTGMYDFKDGLLENFSVGTNVVLHALLWNSGP